VLVVYPHALSAEAHAVLEHENITLVRLPKEQFRGRAAGIGGRAEAGSQL
jgi:hypothetical protein